MIQHLSRLLASLLILSFIFDPSFAEAISPSTHIPPPSLQMSVGSLRFASETLGVRSYASRLPRILFPQWARVQAALFVFSAGLMQAQSAQSNSIRPGVPDGWNQMFGQFPWHDFIIYAWQGLALTAAVSIAIGYMVNRSWDTRANLRGMMAIGQWTVPLVMLRIGIRLLQEAQIAANVSPSYLSTFVIGWTAIGMSALSFLSPILIPRITGADQSSEKPTPTTVPVRITPDPAWKKPVPMGSRTLWRLSITLPSTLLALYFAPAGGVATYSITIFAVILAMTAIASTRLPQTPSVLQDAAQLKRWRNAVHKTSLTFVALYYSLRFFSEMFRAVAAIPSRLAIFRQLVPIPWIRHILLGQLADMAFLLFAGAFLSGLMVSYVPAGARYRTRFLKWIWGLAASAMIVAEFISLRTGSIKFIGGQGMVGSVFDWGDLIAIILTTPAAYWLYRHISERFYAEKMAPYLPPLPDIAKPTSSIKPKKPIGPSFWKRGPQRRAFIAWLDKARTPSIAPTKGRSGNRMAMLLPAIPLSSERPAVWKLFLIVNGAMVVQLLVKAANRWIAIHALPSWNTFAERPGMQKTVSFLEKPLITYHKVMMLSLGDVIIGSVIGSAFFPSVYQAISASGPYAALAAVLVSWTLGYWVMQLVILLTPGPWRAKELSIIVAHMRKLMEFSQLKLRLRPILLSILVPAWLMFQERHHLLPVAGLAWHTLFTFALPVIFVTLLVQMAASIYKDPFKKMNLEQVELPPELQEILEFKIPLNNIPKLLWAGALYAPVREELMFRLVGFKSLEWIFSHAFGNAVFSWVVPWTSFDIGLGLPVGTFLAILISGAAFGLVHRTNVIGASFAQFGLGIILGLLYYQSGTLLAPIFLHMMLNGKLLSLTALPHLCAHFFPSLQNPSEPPHALASDA